MAVLILAAGCLLMAHGGRVYSRRYLIGGGIVCAVAVLFGAAEVYLVLR